ncbi:hypothetical protein GCM10023080_040190 [Streptomyces pseudoechinosporeus]
MSSWDRQKQAPGRQRVAGLIPGLRRPEASGNYAPYLPRPLHKREHQGTPSLSPDSPGENLGSMGGCGERVGRIDYLTGHEPERPRKKDQHRSET